MEEKDNLNEETSIEVLEDVNEINYSKEDTKVEEQKDYEEKILDNEEKQLEANVVSLNESPKFEEVVIEKKKQEIRTDSYFDGKLIELIGWNILRYLLTTVTVGIAGPWADCMLYRYKINHTVLNGKRMKFIGNGGEYFVEKFKWIFFSIITLGIYSFWIPIKKNRWIVSNIHFEDEEFVKGESYFDGRLIQLIGVNLLTGMLNTLSFGLLYPFSVCFKLRWLCKHSIISRKKIVFKGQALGLLGKYILWMFLTVITLGIYGLWLGIKMMKWQSKHTSIKVAGEEEEKDNSWIWLLIVVGILIFMAVLFISLIMVNKEAIINNEFLISIFGPDGFIESIKSGGQIQETQSAMYDYYG